MNRKSVVTAGDDGRQNERRSRVPCACVRFRDVERRVLARDQAFEARQTSWRLATRCEDCG